MKRRRLLGLLVLSAVSLILLSACISDESRGWAAPVPVDETQVVSSRKGKLDGVDTRSDPTPAWTGMLSAPLSENDTRLLSTAISPTDTPFQGDLLYIESEIVRVRSLTINGAEREMHLDRGFGGTVASSHSAGATIEALRRAWRFPDDWHIRSSSARSLDAVYGTPVTGGDGVMYVGDYGGWVYAFDPASVSRDAANDDTQPDTAIVDLGDAVIGGVALDEDTGMLYATAADELFAISTDRMKAALAAGGGEVEPEAGFRFQADDDIWAPPVLEDGTVYVASLDGNLYALDSATGSATWTFDGTEGLVTTPVIIDDLILVAGFDSALFAVNKATGSLEWDFAVDNWIMATPTVEEGTAYFGDFDGVLHAVDIESGTNQWSLPLDRGKIRAAVAVAGDIVVAGTDEGWLIGVNRATQQRVWERDVGSDILADLTTSGDEVLIAPQGCTTLPGGNVKTYYRAVEPETGTLRSAEGIC